jgi:hypothetical protein
MECFNSVNKGVQEKDDWDDWSKGRSEAGTIAYTYIQDVLQLITVKLMLKLNVAIL